LNERIHPSEDEKEREGGRKEEGRKERVKRAAEINIRPRAPTVGLGWRLRRKYAFPRKGRQLALVCFMNDGALSRLLPERER
jgi:hypothetical protein